MSYINNGAPSIAVTTLGSIYVRDSSSKDIFIWVIYVNYTGWIRGKVRIGNPEDGCSIGICNINISFVISNKMHRQYWKYKSMVIQVVLTRSTPRVLPSTGLTLGNMKQSSRAWNSLSNSFFCHVRHILIFSWKSISPFCPVMLPANTGPENKKCFKGAKCSRLFLVSYPTYPEKLMNIYSSLFPWYY